MLAFDIETTGVKIHTHVITVAAVHGTVAGEMVSRAYDFTDAAIFEEEKKSFLDVLDNAEELCGFNSYQFDIPFIQHFFKVSADRVSRWILKTFDMFHICKTLYKTTFPLNELLRHNGIDVKTSSGAEAVNMFYEGRLEELKDYCLNDSIKTWEVHSQRIINTPKLGKIDTYTLCTVSDT